MEKTINLNELANEIGNLPKEVTLPNGQTRMSVNWDKETAQSALMNVYPNSSTGKKIIFDGPAPGWFVSALTHIVHPCLVGLKDPKVGTIDIPHLKHGQTNPEGEISFNVVEGEKCVLINWSIDNGTMPPVYDEKNLSKIVVPEIPEGKEVCISGRGPNYVTVALGEAYAHTNKAVSYYQPQTKGYTVGITHTKEREVGDVIPEEEIKKDIENFAKKALENTIKKVDPIEYVKKLIDEGVPTYKAKKTAPITIEKGEIGETVTTYNKYSTEVNSREIKDDNEYKVTWVKENGEPVIVDDEGHNNTWIMTMENIQKMYDFKDGLYFPKDDVRTFIQAQEDCLFDMKRWGTIQPVSKGDFINITDINKPRVIEQQIFYDTHTFDESVSLDDKLKLISRDNDTRNTDSQIR